MVKREKKTTVFTSEIVFQCIFLNENQNADVVKTNPESQFLFERDRRASAAMAKIKYSRFHELEANNNQQQKKLRSSSIRHKSEMIEFILNLQVDMAVFVDFDID